MSRRAGIAAAVLVTLLFFGIRLGIRLLAHEAAPPTNPVVVDRSRSTPLAPASPFQLKDDARAKLRMLASEARETHDTKSAVAAYAAEEAVGRDDCAAAKSQTVRADDAMAKDSRSRTALESAKRAVDAYCDLLDDGRERRR